MKQTIHLLDKSHESELLRNRILLLYSITAVALMAIVISEQLLAIDFIYLIMIVTLLFPIILYYLNQRIKKKIQKLVNGSIVLVETFEIQLKNPNQIYNEADIKEIRLNYEGYLGEGFLVKNFLYPKQQNHTFGTGNKITFKIDDQLITKYCFLTDREDRDNFFRISEIAMKISIIIHETTRGEKTYSGRKLKYKEIQEFKTRNSTSKKV